MRRCFVALIVLGIWGIVAHAEAIDTYHTTITVHPSGALHIDEEIVYDFGALQRHGIFRDIPLTVKIEPLAPEVSIGLSGFAAQADGRPVPVSRREILSQTSGKMARYRIGDPARTVTGRHTYTLAYDAARGVLPSPMAGMDAIRWNAVGSGSNVPTYRAVADLLLPPALSRDRVRIQVFTGRYGSSDSRAHYRWIDEHHVRFEVDDLLPHEALTVEANYPKGLLAQTTDTLHVSWTNRLLGSWHWVGLAGFVLFLLKYVRVYGAAKPSGPVAPQYYPPKGLSLLQSGLILDKFADKEDFSAAILELGALGYLTIDQPGEDADPVIRRTGKSVNEGELSADQRYLLDQILFKDHDAYIIKTNDAHRAEQINEQLDHVNAILYAWSVADGYMRTDPQRTRKSFLYTVGTIAGILSLAALVTTLMLYGAGYVFFWVMATVFVGVGISIFAGARKSRSKIGMFFSTGWLLLSSFIFGNMAWDILDPSQLITTPLILFPIVVGLTWYYYRRIGLLTPKGRETYRYLLGYSEFMKRVEQDRIRRFLARDPHYLDRGLPYAVLFGHNQHWIEMYESLQIPQPDWYVGDMHHFNSFARAVADQATPPASESGGFSGGGSFSGGGGGGGGVGSW